ncbi:MAG: hypothetical protein EAX96_10155 [Candidatus Lokiarchaeota archaeon]|nr:hypothetical protein [Candidatus Lokiarchaeota archaeon]
MVIRDFHKKPRSLCPRCGSPMMSELDEQGNEKYKKCPTCGFIQSSSKAPVLKFRDTVDAPLPSKKPSLVIYDVMDNGISQTTELNSNNTCLVLDREQKIIWVWKGKNASPKLAYAAGTQATRLKSSEKLYSAKIETINEGSEPENFPKGAGAKAKASASGSANFYRIEKGELKKIDKAVFTTGDTYVVDKGDVIYIWVGKEASVDEKFTGAHIATMIDSQRSGEPKIVTIDQGHETKEFKTACGGIKIVDKDVAESILSHYEKPYTKPVLFRVSSEEYDNIEEVEYIQVPLSSNSLDSEDVFILDDAGNDTCYIWIGVTANVKEKVVARKIAMKFEDERAGAQKEVFIEQGEEPEEFKRLLGM